MGDYELEVPRPLPANADAWGAFLRVADVRRVGVAGAGGPAWADIAEVLRLTNQWVPEVQRKLEICFRELMRAEHEIRQRKSAAAKAKAAGGRRRGRGR